MTHGIDNDFLVAIEITDHPFHAPADTLLQGLLDEGQGLRLLRKPWRNSFTSSVTPVACRIP
jgi:hypothetical protein